MRYVAKPAGARPPSRPDVSTGSREVAPGPHTLRVSNTLVWKTVSFEVKPGEQVRFAAINRAGRLTYPMLVIFGAGPLYLTVKRLT